MINLETIPELEQINSNEGRTYKDIEGNIYKSVTTFLSEGLDHSWVAAWKDRIGHDKANEITQKASERGTAIHNALEAYLLGKPHKELKNKTYERMYNCLLPYINRIDNVRCLETRLFAKQILLAGTVDCIGEYDGVLSIIDFKTSTKIKSKEDTEQYWLQVTLYALLYYYRTGTFIEQVVILITYEQSFYPSAYVGRTKDYLPKVKKLLQSK